MHKYKYKTDNVTKGLRAKNDFVNILLFGETKRSRSTSKEWRGSNQWICSSQWMCTCIYIQNIYTYYVNIT